MSPCNLAGYGLFCWNAFACTILSQLSRFRLFPRRAFRRSLTQTLLLTAAFVSNGCTDSPSFVKPGPVFAAAEKAPPSKALVYFYWPREEQGK